MAGGTSDFSHLQPVFGSVQATFEALAVELFRSSVTIPVWRNDGKGGDGGCEAYTIDDKAVVGMQAKCFGDGHDVRLTANRLAQISKSMSSAIRNYPNLAEYRIYIAQELTKEENKKVQAAWRAAGGKKIPLTVVAREALLLRLRSPECSHLRSIFFGESALTPSRLAAHAAAEVKRAQERYHPTLHAVTDNQQILEGVIEAGIWFSNESKTVALLEFLGEAKAACRSANEAKLNEAEAAIKQAVSLVEEKQIPTDAKSHLERLKMIRQEVNKANQALEPLLQDISEEGRARRQRALEVMRPAHRAESLLDREATLSTTEGIVVSGSGGSGKTHVACHLTTLLAGHKRPIVYRSLHHMPQARDVKHWILDAYAPELTWPSFLEALRALARLHQMRLPILLDSINEAIDITSATQQVNDLAIELQADPDLQLIVLLRPNALLVRSLLKQSYTYREFVSGWEADRTEIVDKYLAHYKIGARLTEDVRSRFSANPILLLTFCETYQGRIIEKPVGLDDLEILRLLFDFLRQKCSVTPALNTRLDNEGPALDLLSRLGRLAVHMGLRRAATEADALKIFGDTQYDGSLLKATIETDLILHREVDRDSRPYVQFHLDPLFEACYSFGLLVNFKADHYAAGQLQRTDHGKTSVYRLWHLARYLLANQVPPEVPAQLGSWARSGRTRLWHLAAIRGRPALLLDVIEPVWKQPAAGRKDLQAVQVLLQNQETASRALRRLLTCAASGTCIGSSQLLHDYLAPLGIADRDILLHRAIWDVRRGFERAFNPSANQTADAAALVWLLAVPHHTIRDLATAAMIDCAEENPQHVLALAFESKSWGDPYIEDRLLSALVGAASVWPDELLEQIARDVIDQWRPGAPFYTTHAIIRDWVTILAELSLARGGLSKEGVAEARPPFDLSHLPPTGTDDEVSEQSIAGFYVGPMHKDFLNYTVGSRYEGRRNYGVTPEYIQDVRRLSWRVKQLGWTDEKFKAIDHDIAMLEFTGGERVMERWGKKYGRIAFQELLGELQDRRAAAGDNSGYKENHDREMDPGMLPAAGVEAIEWPKLDMNPANDTKWLANTPTRMPPDIEALLDGGKIPVSIMRITDKGPRRSFCRIEAYGVPENMSRADLEERLERINPTGGHPDNHYAYSVEYPHSAAWDVEPDDDLLPLSVHHAWESYHSELNEGGRTLPVTEFAREAGLNFNRATAEFEIAGEQVTWTSRVRFEGTSALTIAAEPLAKFLANRKRRLVYWVQNERSTKANYRQTRGYAKPSKSGLQYLLLATHHNDPPSKAASKKP